MEQKTSMTKNKPFPLESEVDTIARCYGAEEQKTSSQKTWIFKTQYGPMSVTAYPTWIAMRFHEPDQVTGSIRNEINRHSGKWNINHFKENNAKKPDPATCYHTFVLRINDIAIEPDEPVKQPEQEQLALVD